MIPRGIRNNNPGNIVWTGKPIFAGELGAEPEGTFAVFDTALHGIGAISSNLIAYQDRHGCKTVGQLIRRWSTTDQDVYVRNVAAAVGVSADAPIDIHDVKIRRAIVLAIIQQENGQQPYSAPVIDAALGVSDLQEAVPIEEKSTEAPAALVSDPQPQTSSQPMGAFLAFLPSILQAIPSLIQVFGKGDEAAVKAKADKAQVVTDLLVKATDAVNLQDAVEKIQNDPEKQAAAQAAVQQSWYMLQEVGGGIDAARQAAVAQASTPLYKDRAFIISLLLFVLVSAVIASVVLQQQWTADNRTTTLQSILNILWAIAGYFLGSSMSSAKKDDALAQK